MARELELRCAAYTVLRRSNPGLPVLRLPSDNAGSVRALNTCFAAARRLLAGEPERAGLFSEVERLAPGQAQRLAGTLTEVENTLAVDPAADVLGPLLEAASTSSARKQRGQHFTPPRVVDLVLRLARAATATHVIDPTCGTGAFLTRVAATDKGPTRWGCELDPRTAALAGLNLGPRPGATPGRVHTGDLLALHPGARIDGHPLPLCDAVVGNLPFVRLHRQDLARWRQVLGKRWAARDATLVTGKRTPRLRLSGHADLYALLFFHLTDLMAPGGRLALITANAYLDAAYGRVLKQLFCRHFRVVAVVESRTEPWFADASVNTVITVLERPDDHATPTARPTRFVQLNRPLGAEAELSALVRDIEAPARTGCEDDLPFATVEHQSCRIRLVEPAHLEATLDSDAEPWSAYLRAPDLYFRLCAHPALRPVGELAHIQRGVTTNWNAFFYPPADTPVEARYLRPVVRSPRISRTIAVRRDDLVDRLFVCTTDRTELRRRGHGDALAWIDHGRTLRNRQGRPLHQTLQRTPWYGLNPTRYRLLLTKTTHDTHLHRLLDHRVAVDQRLYGVAPQNPDDTELLAALLNSSLTALMTEVVGVASLGEGALDLPVTIARQRLLLPDPSALSDAARQRILDAFHLLSQRPVLPVEQEVTRPDRQSLDRAVLAGLALDVDRTLPQLYDGLSALTRERLTLARKRRALGGPSLE